MNIIDEFVDFLILNNCEGCNDCEPRLSEDWSICVCAEKGRANFFIETAVQFKKLKNME